MAHKPFAGAKGPRKPPTSPVPGRVFHDLRVGDKVQAVVSPGKPTGATGTIVGPHTHHKGWKVEWDEPKFGVLTSWVSWPNLEPLP